MADREPIQTDGVNVIEVTTVTPSMFSSETLRNFKIDLLGRARDGNRYRVLLERIE